MPTFNPSTWEAEAGGSLQDQSGLQSQFQDSQGYTKKPCQKIKINPPFYISLACFSPLCNFPVLISVDDSQNEHILSHSFLFFLEGSSMHMGSFNQSTLEHLPEENTHSYHLILDAVITQMCVLIYIIIPVLARYSKDTKTV